MLPSATLVPFAGLLPGGFASSVLAAEEVYDLRIELEAASRHIFEGTTVLLRGTFRGEESGELTDQDEVEVRVEDGFDGVATYTPTRESEGVYEVLA